MVKNRYRLGSRPKARKEEQDMAKKILVVVDMQNDFTTGVLGNQECAAVIPRVEELIRKGGYDAAVATMDTHTEDYLNTNEGKNLPVEHCIRGTEGWRIVSSVDKALRETFGERNYRIFEKPSFGSVDLAEFLRQQSKEDQDLQIDFAGVCTGICVISNVALAKAFCPEARVRVIASACACVTLESHETALNAMKTFQVTVV